MTNSWLVKTIRTIGQSNAAQWTAAALILAAAQPAAGALTPEVKCEVNQLKAVASYCSCVFKQEASALAKNVTTDFTKCQTKIDLKFPKLEASAMCPSEGDVVDIRDRTDDLESQIATILSGGTLPTAACGDGNVDLGEDCDVGDLDGETCATQGLFNGTLACGPGCNFDTSGCNATRFEDNGNTVIDHQTGLEWEKKVNQDNTAVPADPHDADNGYVWATSGNNPTGPLFMTFLPALNGTVDHPTLTTINCFANHCDWRIPTVDELKSIVDLGCGVAPCVEDPLLLPTKSGGYWTASTRASLPNGAYFVTFLTGTVSNDVKTSSYFARAVRSIR